MKLHDTQYPDTKPRLADYFYNGWKISHYTLPPEQFMASKGAKVPRDDTKEGIEKQITSCR